MCVHEFYESIKYISRRKILYIYIYHNINMIYKLKCEREHIFAYNDLFFRNSRFICTCIYYSNSHTSSLSHVNFAFIVVKNQPKNKYHACNAKCFPSQCEMF